MSLARPSSHCVRSTLYDMRDHLQTTAAGLTHAVWILEDAMSPVPPPPIEPLPPALDFPRVAERAMAEFRQAGMHVVKTTDPVVLGREWLTRKQTMLATSPTWQRC